MTGRTVRAAAVALVVAIGATMAPTHAEALDGEAAVSAPLPAPAGNECPPDDGRPPLGSPTPGSIPTSAATLVAPSPDGSLALHLVTGWDGSLILLVEDPLTQDQWRLDRWPANTSYPDSFTAIDGARWCGDGWVRWGRVEGSDAPWSKPRHRTTYVARPDGSGRVDLGGVASRWSPTGGLVVTQDGASDEEMVVLDPLRVHDWEGERLGAERYRSSDQTPVSVAWSPDGTRLAHDSRPAADLPGGCLLGWGPECEDPAVVLWSSADGSTLTRSDVDLVGWLRPDVLAVRGECGQYLVDTRLVPVRVVDGEDLAPWIDAGCLPVLFPPHDGPQCPAPVPVGPWQGSLPAGAPLPDELGSLLGVEPSAPAVHLGAWPRARWRTELADVGAGPGPVVTVEVESAPGGGYRPVWRRSIDADLLAGWATTAGLSVDDLSWCPNGSWLVWREHTWHDGDERARWVLASADGAAVHELGTELTFWDDRAWAVDIGRAEGPGGDDGHELSLLRWEGLAPTEVVPLGPVLSGSVLQAPASGTLAWTAPTVGADAEACATDPTARSDPDSPCAYPTQARWWAPGRGPVPVHLAIGGATALRPDGTVLVDLPCGSGVVDPDGGFVLPDDAPLVRLVWSSACLRPLDVMAPVGLVSGPGDVVVHVDMAGRGGAARLLAGEDELARTVVGDDGATFVVPGPLRPGPKQWTVRYEDEHRGRLDVPIDPTTTWYPHGSCLDLPVASYASCVAGVRFDDLTAEHPFAEPIGWLWEARVVGAVAGADFAPGRSVSRQVLAAWLRRDAQLGVDASPCAQAPFPDVAVDSPFCADVDWLAGEGMAEGFTDGGFHPTAVVSRQVLVAWLWRRAGSPEPAGGAPAFADVAADHPFATPIAWAAEQGIVTGYPDGRVRPGQPLTRQAAAAVLWRAGGAP